jgi:integrase
MSDFSYANPTRTPHTVKAYLKRAEDLKKKAKVHYDFHDHDVIDARQWVAWLISKRTTYANTTWRQYKSAALCTLESELQLLDERHDPSPWVEAIETLKVEDGQADSTSSGKTSSRKMKKFSTADFDALDLHLQNKPHHMHQSLRDWLRAGILTGLRPSEWKQTVWVDVNGVPALSVQNAKHTNGRAHGETRTIVMHRMNADELSVVQRHLHRVQQWEASANYERMYASCVQKLYAATRFLWPKQKTHPTLYSTRHQFVADAKASHLSLVEIAALLGHAVDNTATLHYGKRMAGQQLLKVHAVAEEVARIKLLFSGYPDARLLPPTNVVSPASPSEGLSL